MARQGARHSPQIYKRKESKKREEWRGGEGLCEGMGHFFAPHWTHTLKAASAQTGNRDRGQQWRSKGSAQKNSWLGMDMACCWHLAGRIRNARGETSVVRYEHLTKKLQKMYKVCGKNVPHTEIERRQRSDCHGGGKEKEMTRGGGGRGKW
jgi:hypothetical protein